MGKSFSPLDAFNPPTLSLPWSSKRAPVEAESLLWVSTKLHDPNDVTLWAATALAEHYHNSPTSWAFPDYLDLKCLQRLNLLPEIFKDSATQRYRLSQLVFHMHDNARKWAESPWELRRTWKQRPPLSWSFHTELHTCLCHRRYQADWGFLFLPSLPVLFLL